MTPLHDLRASVDAVLARIDDSLRPLKAGADGAPAPPDPPWLASYDVATRYVRAPAGTGSHVAYVATLVDPGRLWREVIDPLSTGQCTVASLPGVRPVADRTELTHQMLSGYAALWADAGGPPAVVDVRAAVGRHVDEATTESVIHGPKAAFVERLDTNVGLIRDHLRDPSLRIERILVGRRSRTQVGLLYVADLAAPELVERARKGLQEVAVDNVRSAADIATELYSGSWTPFPLVEQTERPDKVIAALVNGRVALLADGSPFAVVVPTNVWRFVQDSEVAVLGSALVAFSRVLRILGLFAATGAAGLYVAATSSTTTILPIRLAVNVSASRFGLPYPPLTETLIALLIADVLVEATMQASKNIGTALTIVGTLIIGQMLVQARLASNLMLVVVAMTVLGSFLTVDGPMSYALRIWKYVLVLCAGIGGLSGWVAGWLVLVGHMAGLKSAGVPYLSPFGPARPWEIWKYGLKPMPPGQRGLRPRSWRPREAGRARPEAGAR
jgi:spore germination protein KA